MKLGCNYMGIKRCNINVLMRVMGVMGRAFRFYTPEITSKIVVRLGVNFRE